MITGRYLHGRLLPSIQEPAGNRRISVDSPVAQKRPVAADVFESFQIHVAYKDFFPVVRGFSDDAAKGIAEERRAPEFESLAGSGLATDVPGLEADSIHHRNINSIRDGVRALNGTPGVVLHHAKLSFLRGMPTDRRRIKEHGSPLQRREPRALRKPLIPADQRTQAAGGGVEGAESEITGSEVGLFVVERVVGNVHLAVEPAQRTIGIEDGRGVVIDAGRPLFEHRCNYDDAVLACGGGEFIAGRAGNGLGQVEERMIFSLAKILRLKKFRQADNLRAASRGIGHAFQSFGEILRGIGSARHLHQRHTKFVRGQGVRSSDDQYSRTALSYQLSAIRSEPNAALPKAGSLRLRSGQALTGLGAQFGMTRLEKKASS